MKKIFLFFILTILLSCKRENSLNGIYEYIQSKENENSLYETGCSVVGYIELKDGYYYNGLTGSSQRFPFNIENDKIIVDNPVGGQLIIDIVDNNTIGLMGCLFRKRNESKIIGEKDSNVEESVNKEMKSNIINNIEDFPIYNYQKLIDKRSYEDGVFPETFKEYIFLYGTVKKVKKGKGYNDYEIHITKTSKEFDNLHRDMESAVNKNIVMSLEPDDLFDRNGKIKNGWKNRYDLSFKDYKKLKDLLVEGRKIKFSYVEGGAGTTGTASAGIFYFNYIEKID